MDPGLIELFVDGNEDCLPDSGRLDALGLGSGSVVFMLQRMGWRWDECGSDITLSGEGLVATREAAEGYRLVTGGSPMTEGRHYWEVEVTWPSGNRCEIMVGAVRPGLDHNKTHHDTSDAYYIFGGHGALYGGNGKPNADSQGQSILSLASGMTGQFATGDRIGVLLDLDAGWMRFYRNGKRCGPGNTEGVTGPLVRAAQLYYECDNATAVPSAVAPEGAGGADEPWGPPSPEPESETDY